MSDVFNPAAALAQLDRYWAPRVIATVNDQYVKVAKLKGRLAWHEHADEDELFMVVYGRLTIEFTDRSVHLGPGDCCVVPKATMHNPVAEQECGVVLIETRTTRHTGDLQIDATVPIERQLY